jgi:hypothetical protein
MEEYRKGLFLAGGISGCEDWQDEMVGMLADTDLILLNPRRDDFPEDPTKAQEETPWQIEWEFIHLRKSRARLFWFPSATICPITLFELGKYAANSDPLFVGVDKQYKRKIDVEVQLSLSRPWDCRVSTSLKQLANRVRSWSKNQ